VNVGIGSGNVGSGGWNAGVGSRNAGVGNWNGDVSSWDVDVGISNSGMGNCNAGADSSNAGTEDNAMRDVDLRRFTMLERVWDFGHRHRALFRPGTAGDRLFAALKERLVALQEASLQQTVGGISTSASGQVRARRALLAQLEAIKATTAAATKRHRLPDAFARLRKPRDGELATIARGIVHEVTPNEALLIEHHLPPTFLTDLRDAIATFERTVAARQEGRSQRMTASSDIRRLLIEAGAIAKQLDAVVPNALGRRRSDVELWKDTRRVLKKAGRRKRRKTARRES